MAEENEARRKRGEGTPLIPSIPQDEREGAPEDDPSIPQAERKGAPEDDPSIPQGERVPRKRSGGPKTPAGKAVVWQNPIKHGVLAQTSVIPLVEREEGWQRLRRRVMAYFEIEGEFLEALGDRAASLIWRLQRVVRFETEAIGQYLEDVPEELPLAPRARSS